MKVGGKAVSKPTTRAPAGKARKARKARKATYSLPADLLDKLERASGNTRAKSGIVAEALVEYFAGREKQQLEAEFEGACSDPTFVADNRAILRDFAALDADIERGMR